jgi:2-polyprenyl-6-hydroxyphenyl methylase/3-demethylubiquinone-9 3-methyltransferase
VPYWPLWPRAAARRNDQAMYSDDAADWWTGRRRWLRTMHNLVPARLDYFDGVVGNWNNLGTVDIGCGGGFMSEALAARGAKVTGIDPSAPAVAAARAHAAENGLSIDYREGAGERLPFADASLDCAVIVDVLEHLNDPEETLREVRRVLKPGGFLLFDTLNRSWLAAFVFVTLGEDLLRIGPRGTHDPQMFIKPAELREMLTRSGFSGVHLRGLGPVGINRRLDAVFGRLPFLSLMYIGSARKTDAGRASLS